MTQEYFWALLSLIGLCTQIGITALLWLFFLLLKQHAGRRSRFFRLWTAAWAVLLASLLVLAFGLYLLPYMEAKGSVLGALLPVALLLYQLGKLVFLSLLLAGAFEYVDGPLPRYFMQFALGAAGAYALASYPVSGDLNGLMLWQDLLCVLIPAYAAVRLFRLPPSRRSLGSRVTGMTLLCYAGLWVLYGLALIQQRRYVLGGSGPGVVNLVANYNGYLDALLQLLLAFGMVLMLLEEARRETNAAHAELAVAHEKLLHESLTDPLTGVYNRLAFTRGVFLQTAAAIFGSVFIFDLDNLKLVNDSHGHEAGDELLKHFVMTLRGGLRPADQLYRWGGDEFLLLLPGATYASVAPRLNQLMYRATPLVMFDGHVTLKLEVSMGGADYADLDSLRSAVNLADHAMYEQKRIHKTAPPSGEADVGDEPA